MAAIQDALLVAGGLGTRMLPTSASVPKEALPLVDVPALVHLAREAKTAGVKRLHIVTSPRKDLSNLLGDHTWICLLYTSPSPRDATLSRMPSSA